MSELLKEFVREVLTENAPVDPADRATGIAIFKKAFGQNALGSHKASFANESNVDGQIQLWFYVNPTEFIVTKKARVGNYSRTGTGDKESMIGQLVDRLKKACDSGWNVVAREKPDGWHLVLVKG